MASHSILTMSRGDEHRIADWLQYHYSIGFTNFHIILDNPIDNTEAIARHVASENHFNLTVKTIDADGDYYDGLTAEDRWAAIRRWKEKHAVEIERSGLPIVDPLSMRQYKYLPNELNTLQRRGSDAWLALIDIDEYIALPETADIASLTQGADTPRLRIFNYNFDMTGWDGVSNVRYFTQRWSRNDIEDFGMGWQNRVKTIARCDHLLPLVSVHALSRGPFRLVPPDKARLHHYKFPNQGNVIPYSVTDKVILPSDL